MNAWSSAEQRGLHPRKGAVAGVEVAEVPAVLAGQRIVGFVQQRQRQDAGRQQDHAGRAEPEGKLYVGRCADAGHVAGLRHSRPCPAVVVDARSPVLNLEHIGRHAHGVVAQVLGSVGKHPVELGRCRAQADLRANDAVVSLGLELQIGRKRVDGQRVDVRCHALAVDPEQPSVLYP